AAEWGICPQCANPSITISRGIEVGHIFQLGEKYTKSMNMTYSDETGTPHFPFMGCYGIGIGRLAASVCEVRHDDYGPVWPTAIAPWQIHICCVPADDEQVKTFADNLYEQLQKLNIEVLYDDRNVSVGVMFSDADLLGVPIRVIVSPRNMKDNCCEIVTRDKSINIKVKTDEIVESLIKMI
ncbi:MAG: His/Gly/Thr/Pro-type tRNA ligase C-terminal domain-containing protein, partial [Oscillospiraceae bacterium]|nr:His/Gly/Thr/Pro-type tRNA ligase C-terminal domain-containing protein [Oscillospiraceae bacterium]